MMRPVRITEPAQMQALHRKFECFLPGPLPEDPERLKHFLVFKIEKEKKKEDADHTDHIDHDCGLAVCFVAGENLEIRYLYLQKAYRNSQDMRQMLKLLLDELSDGVPDRCIYWRYRLPAEKKDVFLKLISQLPGYTCESSLLSTWMRIDAAGVCSRKSLRPMERMTDQQVHREGYRMISPEELRQDADLVRQLEQLQSEDPQYLSPLQSDDRRLSQYSFILLDEKTHQLVSWILCNRVSEEELEISRAYTVKAFRSIRLWMTFFGSVIYRISESYPRFRFQVEAGNQKMFSVMKAYFSDAIEELQEERLMKISRKNIAEN